MMIVSYWQDSESLDKFVACAHPMCPGLYRVEERFQDKPGSGMVVSVQHDWPLGWLRLEEIEPVLTRLNQ